MTHFVILYNYYQNQAHYICNKILHYNEPMYIVTNQFVNLSQLYKYISFYVYTIIHKPFFLPLKIALANFLKLEK